MGKTDQKPPDITVVIPTTAKHHEFVQVAINSVDLPVETIVVNDSLSPLFASGAKVINRTEGDAWGAGKARNVGVKASQAECILFLDADDYLLPGALKDMWGVYLETGNIVYGDLVRTNGNVSEYYPLPPQYRGNNVDLSSLREGNSVRPYCCLIPRVVHDFVGGYDEIMPTHEDLDYEKRIDAAGFCAEKIDRAIYVYRWHTGERRNFGDENDPRFHTARTIMYNRYKKYLERKERYMGCGCDGAPVINSPFKNKTREELPVAEGGDELFIEFLPRETAVKMTMVGPVTRTPYQFGTHSRIKVRKVGYGDGEVAPEDAKVMINQRNRRYNDKMFKVYLRNTSPPKKEPDPPIKIHTTPGKITPPPFVEKEIKQTREIEEISTFSIMAMKKTIAAVDTNTIKTWLKQERAGKKRKGMIVLLEKYENNGIEIDG